MFFLKALPSRQMIARYATTFPQVDVQRTADALTMLRNASLLMRELEGYFAAVGLSQTRFLILILIDREKERNALPTAEILEKLDVSKVVVSKALQGLAADGLVSIAQDAHDKRVRLVELTPEGAERLHSVLPGYFELINRFALDLESNEGMLPA